MKKIAKQQSTNKNIQAFNRTSVAPRLPDNTISYLKHINTKAHSLLVFIGRLAPSYQPITERFTTVLDGLIEHFVANYMPYFTAADIRFMKVLKISPKPMGRDHKFFENKSSSPTLTDRDIELLRLIRKCGHRLLKSIGQKNPAYWHAVFCFADVFDDLLKTFAIYHMPYFIDKLQTSELQGKIGQTKENPETADNTEGIGLLKRPEQMTEIKEQKKKKKYRQRKELEFPDLGPQANINRTKQQTGLRLPPTILKEVDQVAESHDLSRNEWITETIKEKLKVEALHLFPN